MGWLAQWDKCSSERAQYNHDISNISFAPFYALREIETLARPFFLYHQTGIQGAMRGIAMPLPKRSRFAARAR